MVVWFLNGHHLCRFNLRVSVAGGTERTLRACSQRASCEEDGGRRAGGAGNGCVADAEAGGDEHAGVQVRWGHFIPKRVWVRLGLTKLIVWAE